MENKYLSVTALNKYIAYKFDSDNALRKVYLKGEISNLRISNGHLYFSLKDESSEIRAIMFAGSASRLKFMPQDGLTVLVSAQVTVYQKNGSYNLTVSEIEEVGLGQIHLNFLRLKDKLQKEGLFDDDKKLAIPSNIYNIGVITSATADAFHDIMTTINKRWPMAKVFLYPSLVQGTEAPKAIIRAVKLANQNQDLDVLIIARGGGSAEDLSCFNDEELARVVFASKIPTVSGIGHEADFTITDFVVSKRAATPTAAAVAVTKDQYLIAKELNDKLYFLVNNYKKILEKKFYEYENISSNHYFKNFIDSINKREDELKILRYNLSVHSPLASIDKGIARISELDKRIELYNINEKINEFDKLVLNHKTSINTSFKNIISKLDDKFAGLLDKMIILNPLNLLKKGYVLTYQNNQLLTRADEVKLDSDVKIVFADGEVIAKASEKKRIKLGD